MPVAAAQLPAASAHAVAFTPNPFGIGQDGVLGSVDVLSADLGLPAGATQLTGATGAGDLTVVFTLAVATGGAYDGVTVQATTAGLSFLTVTGAGILTGSGVLPTATRLSLGLDRARFEYPDDGVAAGTSLPTFFVSFASLEPGDVFHAGVASVVASPLPGGTTFGRVDFGSATAVPEPALGSLALAAAAFTTLRGRARERARA